MYPDLVEVIREWGLSAIQNCLNLTFGENSRLKIIEERGILDLYKAESLTFTSNCLMSIGHHGIKYAFVLKSLTLPSSIKSIESQTFGGLREIKTFYYCGAKDQNADIFSSGSSTQPQINATMEVYVSSKYQGGQTFAGKEIKGIDDSKCEAQTDSCSEICLTIKKAQHLHYSLFVFILVLCS